MSNVTTFIQEKIAPWGVRIGNNRYLTIIRNAMCALISLLVIGSMCSLLINFPIEAVANFFSPIAPALSAMNSATMGLLGLFVVLGIAYYGSIEFSIDVFSTTLVALAAFVVTCYDPEAGIDTSGFGSGGILTAILVGFVTVAFFKLFKEHGLTISMPAGVPSVVVESFTALVPGTVVLLIFGVLSVLLGIDIGGALDFLVSPVASVVDTPWGFALYHVLCCLCFWCGINSAAIWGIILPVLAENSAANDLAFAAGEALPHVACISTDCLIWIGGTGTTLGLTLLMVFAAKSAAYKKLGRVSLAPAIVNINEPIIYGTPICFNPIYFFPAVIMPGILAFITFILMDNGIIAGAAISAISYRIPAVLCGWMMSNGAASTTIWSLLILIISTLVYYPFFKVSDNMEYQKEQEAAAEEAKEAETVEAA
jgi:PTS system cellobiose-specific IIC component